MDKLLREFLTETNESLDVVDAELVCFERDPNNVRILEHIFRLVHTTKGTCGFLGLPRLEALAHAAETLMGRFRDGLPVTGNAVTLILSTVDRIKEILGEIGRTGVEPAGADRDLIGMLDQAALAATVGPVSHPISDRRLDPGESSIEDSDRGFRDALGPAHLPGKAGVVPPGTGNFNAAPAKDPENPRKESAGPKLVDRSIRVNLEILDDLMNMVSELVLARNQL